MLTDLSEAAVRDAISRYEALRDGRIAESLASVAFWPAVGSENPGPEDARNSGKAKAGPSGPLR